ncbi:DUF488 domain-containing protein [Stutzerimonas azotifigens]|uniref:DUF488 domain-containing protein n=1 Tax=Stutzerimonas azotifigens TaxID=291995 RepID=UPI0004137BBD|nr:DUF488 family protein [Stutzerimonas azotifigens]
MIQCKRAYEPAALGDGYRVLVDGLWPRGLKKTGLAHDAWRRELAPSKALRQALHRGEVDFAGFRERYRQALAAHPEHWWDLAARAAEGPVTLLYAARDEARNNARVLAEWLEEEVERRADGSSPVCYAGERGP